MVEAWLAQNNELIPSEILLIVSLKADGTPIGMIRFSRIDWVARHADVHCFLGDPDYTRRGFGADALLTAVRYVFDVLNLETIYGLVYSRNTNAKRLYSVFTEGVGVLKHHKYINGEMQDLEVHCLTRESFMERKRADNKLIRYFIRRFNL
ncbi:hypothetical protein WT83_28925 [Burkholderia territorii]|uniref:N-acetyltransferase domain-containing protein n=2 Tax=Burkholderia territorii TaxID=1503055 RepID=A0A108E6K5_9BURK|nr:hypothetical protein WT83_28925 [Burkholderia territorii]